MLAERSRGLWVDWEFEVSRCKLLYIELINNNVLLYSKENYLQYPVINHHGKEYEKESIYLSIYIYIHLWEDPLEKGMSNHSSILARGILCTEEPGRLQSIGLNRIEND